MRIAVIAHLEHPIKEPFAGGLEKHTRLLIDGLVRRGHEVILFADPKSETMASIAEVCERCESFSHHHLRHQSFEFYQTYLSNHFTYMEFIQDLRNRDDVDIIHNNSLHYLPVSFAGTFDVPMVSVLHTPPLRELEAAYMAQKKKLPINHRVVSVSRAVQEDWTGIVPSCVIPNGIEVPKSIDESQKRESYFWFGRLVPEKGVLDAVRAANRAGVRLHLAGPTPNAEYFAEVLASLGPRSRYLGHLDQRATEMEIRKSKAVVVTSKWEEPFGLVAAEALAQGTPVIAYARGGLKEIVTEKTGLLIEPDAIHLLAEALQSFDGRSAKLCWTRARDKFSLDAMISGYEEIYEQLIDEQSHRLLHPPRGLRAHRTGEAPRSFSQVQ